MIPPRYDDDPKFSLAAILLASIAGVIALVSCGHGQSIEGPKEFARDKFARLSAKLPDQWSGTWRFSPRGVVDAVEEPSGNSVLFVGPPGKYVAELLAVGPGTDGRPFSIRAVEHDFTITEASPVPTPPTPPGPNPPTPPTPPQPASRFGLVEQVIALALTVDPVARDESPAIAAAYRGIRDRIASGEFGELSTPLNRFSAERVSQEMQAKVSMGAGWASVREKLGASFSKLYADGKLQTVADIGAAVGELADGFGGVK